MCRQPSSFIVGSVMPDDPTIPVLPILAEKSGDEKVALWQKVYCVPRRFGLGTIFVVMTLFALLFSAMTSWGLPGESILILAGFLVCVGVAQMLLFGGKRPRAASMAAGAVFPFALIVVFVLFDVFYFGVGFNTLEIRSQINELFDPGYAILGAVTGYAGGGVVAAVFLIMDFVERGIYGQRDEARSKQSETTDP